MRRFTSILLTLLACGAANAAEPGADHPLVGRFAGAELTRYDQVAFDAYPLIVKKVAHSGGIEKNADAARVLEGRVTHITYASSGEDSTLAVFRAYQEALTDNGFEVLFECANAACGGRTFNHASPGVRAAYMDFGENDDDQRYLAAHLARPEGDVFVAVHTARNTSSGGASADKIYTQVDIVELKAQESKIVVIKADAMAAKIGTDGRVALYGIYFDTGSAKLKTESKPTLNEISKLLKARTDLKLYVVGHTDNQGEFAYNMELSTRRAAAVVAALVGDYGIAAGRLEPAGVGFLSPVASNADEPGRAKNRRVELVAD